MPSAMCIPTFVQSRHTFYVGNNQKSLCKCSAHKPHSLTSMMFCIVYRGVSEPYDSHVRPIQQSWETLLVLRLFPRPAVGCTCRGRLLLLLLLLPLFHVHNTHDLGGTTRSRDAQGTLVKRAMECLACPARYLKMRSNIPGLLDSHRIQERSVHEFG